MNRRGFLSALGAAIVGATIDPDRLLWVPGKKLISIPKTPPLMSPNEILTASAGEIINDAYLRLGVIGKGEALSAHDVNYALAQLNQMMDRWKYEPRAASIILAAEMAPAYGIHA